MAKGVRSLFGYFGLLVLFVLIDQITKHWAMRFLVSGDRLLFPGFNLTLTFNRGVSFGWLSFASQYRFAALIGFIAIVILFLLWYTWQAHREGMSIVPEVCIIAGALSNLYDRVRIGAVVDFIDLYINNWHWYTFNIADVLLVGGVLLLMIRIMGGKKS